jgi:hypothetical protein
MAARWQKPATAIIGVPGDRDDRLIQDADASPRAVSNEFLLKKIKTRAVGNAAKSPDFYVILSRRNPPDRRCDIVLDEVEAFSQVIQEMEKDEVVVISMTSSNRFWKFCASIKQFQFQHLKIISFRAKRFQKINMLTLIENGEIYSPEPGGVKSVLIAFNKILQNRRH